jgi:cytochrome P450
MDCTTPECIGNHNPAAAQPLGMGARECLGQNFAWFELRLIIAKLIFNFEIRAEDGFQLDWQALRIYLSVERNAVVVRLRAR